VFDLAGGRLWIAFALVPACWVIARSRSGGWSRAGAWLVLALAGQVASLALYEAGPRVSYHHYRPRGELAADLPIAAVLLAQAALVAWGLRRRTGELRAAIARFAPGWRAPALAVLMLLAASKPSYPAARSAAEFGFALAVHLVALANLALAVLELPAHALAALDARLDRWLGARRASGPQPGGPDRFAWTLALASAALAALLNVAVYERWPHVPDEVVYLLHAKYLAAGRLWLEPPPVPAAFDVDLMLLDGGKWYCPVPIGWPVVLALGTLLGAPWLVNPLLGGATVLVAYAFLRELLDRRGARIAVALLAASPWFVFLNMSFMPHAWTLFCALIAALGVARSRRTGSVAWCLLGGAAIGVVALIRPLDGALLAAMLGLWAVGLGGARLRASAIAALVLSTAAVALATLPYNAALTGDPLRFPIQRYVDVVYGPGKNDLGFGPEKGLEWGGLDPWPGHTPLEALVTAQFNVFALDAELFGWSCGSLLFVWLWLVRGRWSRTDKAMLAFGSVVVLSSLFYWFNGGPDFGARYWYLAIVPCIWLTLSGLRAAEESAVEPARARALVAALVAFALFTWIPWRAFDKYRRYRGMGPWLHEALPRDLGRSLVLVAGARFPEFASLAARNPLDLDADAPVFAWDRDHATRIALLERYGDRPVWYVAPWFGKYPVLVAGPATAETVRLDSTGAIDDWPFSR
jgi:hypothetical protein